MDAPLTQASSFDEVAAAIIAETERRGYSPEETIAVLSTGIQESRLSPTAIGRKAGEDRWHGIFQQDRSYPNRDDPNLNIREFLDRLDLKRHSPGSAEIWKNIFWLQQRPSDKSADDAYRIGRQAYLAEIQRHIQQAQDLYSRFAGAAAGALAGAAVGKPLTGWTGDPVWLEAVLRPALGSRLRTLNGWEKAGHGDFKDIRGIMWHHTGNRNEGPESIRRGRPSLVGPLANLHIAPDGIVTVVAVGVCWHAGKGSYPWLPTNDANWHMIGVECAWPTIKDNSYNPLERWPDEQIISMREVAAAITLKLGFGSERNVGHKEYAGRAQGKWDPGNIDMGWFRGEIAKDMRGEFDL